MDDKRKDRLPHIFIKDSVTTSRYTRPLSGGDSGFNLPSRIRKNHAEQLLSQLATIQQEEPNVVSQQKAIGLDAGWGIYISFESEPEFDLQIKSLEFQRSGIELCATKQVEGKTVATVFIPEGKLGYFMKKIIQYRDENTLKNHPRNKDLIEGISAIKLAALEALWTDDPELFPETNIEIWWEVWLRRSDKVNYEDYLSLHAEQIGFTVGSETIRFLDRIILLIRATQEQIVHSIFLLGAVAELRHAKVTADFFTGMGRAEQKEWIDETLKSLHPPSNGAPSICILDTGVNEQHPLLQPVADEADMHTYNPTWGTDDRHGHGTPMAGLAIYGDLTKPLASSDPIKLTHRLESVKVIPIPGHHTNNLLYGAITRESINRIEINPGRQRIYVMAVTAADYRDRGKPSSWSAAIDALCSGFDDEQQRLVVLSAGNTDPQERHQHPNSNMTDAIHDPGQAWNALTVGAFTEKVILNTQKYVGWRPVANSGDLAPSSCTSMNWSKTAWPVKPDIVLEGGNMAIGPNGGTADYIDDALQLLSTGHQFALHKQLVSFGDTSAATAQAARLAAMIQAQYPDYWPETLRALLVHSAKWTQAMRNHFTPLTLQENYRRLLHYCGYGSPDEEELFWSTRSALTLIVQDSIQPFFRDEKLRVKTRDINLHKIPWPTAALHELGGTIVEMKVTLSYFIEPNPGERGWKNKYRYASHGLRFDVKRPLEDLESFQQRLNQQTRDEGYMQRGGATSDSGKWVLGVNLRSLGSIHSDIWRGTAAELAERGYIAVYPVLGWWKERPNLQRSEKRARYALIVSIKTPNVAADIYTPIANQIGIPVEIEV